jgi:NAD(P)-dependent dehydrogenase (short-subunit alcohol dehydrogenase family)
VIATMRSVEEGPTLVAESEAEGLDVEVRQLDVCDPDSVAAAFADADNSA